MSSIAHRSNSTSATSAKSQATLVEIYPDLIDTKELAFEATYEVLPYLPPKNNLVNHLLEMFCIKWLNMSKGGSQIDSTPSAWPSPWILPVHVVSNRQDKDRHQITKIAKCTIDTGNMQGNIVSRDFVENVLEFPFTSLEKLTGEEQKGGTSITGDLHTPLGAIHLTWYYSSSTRVFRNMRFLISPAPHCDMIIGAQSIQREKILSVPCLMGGPVGDQEGAWLVKHEPAKKQLDLIFRIVKDELNNRKGELEGKDDPEGKVGKYQTLLDVVKWTQALHKIAHPKEPGYTYIGEHSKDPEKIWELVDSNYPQISCDLSTQIKPILVTLSIDLNHMAGKEPYKEPFPGWFDGFDYSEVTKSRT